MHIQGSHWPTAVAAASPGAEGRGNGNTHSGAGRSTPLRVDAQRNLEHVLRAAREVFGELGYGAPMEDVARRARVGVGTVYRRFPSKDVLVRRIAEEETARLTDQARTALGQEDDPWSALSRFLRTSVASGAGRLLPPSILRVSADTSGVPGAPGGASGASEAGEARVPQQRQAYGADGLTSDVPAEFRVVAQRGAPEAESSDALPTVPNGVASGIPNGTPARAAGPLEATGEPAVDGGTQALLEVVGQLVERARSAGELRADVTVADVLLVIATGAPSLPDPAQQQAASARLLEILLEGLRSRPAR
ncbi:helix-turn-helix domain-containing protein [Streptomyces sp. NPDC007100]|uniref:TetR/AcrR family transcriptional regulator n=1 Tax=unclassified Streptomyces TaxID=2593676 RepID=UPI0033D2D395